MVQAIGSVGTTVEMVAQENTKKAYDKKALHELRGALPPIFYNCVHGCKTTKEIWDTLKDKYQVNERIMKNLVMKRFFFLNMLISSKTKMKTLKHTTT